MIAVLKHLNFLYSLNSYEFLSLWWMLTFLFLWTFFLNVIGKKSNDLYLNLHSLVMKWVLFPLDLLFIFTLQLSPFLLVEIFCLQQVIKVRTIRLDSYIHVLHLFRERYKWNVYGSNVLGKILHFFLPFSSYSCRFNFFFN